VTGEGKTEPGGPLPDDHYDVFVIEAIEDDTGQVVTVEVTVVAGDHKGEVMTIASRFPGSFVDLIGMPGVLTVTDGTPQLRLDD